MSHDVIADGLNNIMNAKRSRKDSLVLTRYSKLFIGILEIAKNLGYIENYNLHEKKLIIKFGKFMKCGAIKPRFNVSVNNIEKYMKRYLPGRGIGVIIISTNKGLVTHIEAIEKNFGGALIAYFY